MSNYNDYFLVICNNFYREKIHKSIPDIAYGDDYDNEKKDLYTIVFFIY